MKFRTPRRGITPRTKKRCRAIKDFFRKAIGTSSQTESKINSSVVFSVEDLKSKINIIEEELGKVNKRCRDLACLENSYSRGAESARRNEKHDDKTHLAKPGKDTRDVETKLLYKTSKSNYTKSDDSETYVKATTCSKNAQSMNQIINKNDNKIVKDKHSRNCFRTDSKSQKSDVAKRIARNSLINQYLSNSLQSLTEDNLAKAGYSGTRHASKNYIQHFECKERKASGKELQRKKDEEYRSRKYRNKRSDLDNDFIADIIRRQYKPVKLFGRRESDFSQFTAPVCRDQEFTIRNDVEEGSELCSCCFEDRRRVAHRYCRKNDLTDMRSICDARLYSTKRHRRYIQPRVHSNDYNNSAFYDIIPVKEKSSPKSRKKFIEENMRPYGHSKEVPPSPRTHRPRLNLKAQQCEYYNDDILQPKRHQNTLLRTHKHHDPDEAELLEHTLHRRKSQQKLSPINVPDNYETMTSLQSPNYCNEYPTNENDTTLITQVSDKTDKTLSEIKDLLQNFLQEMKKDSSHSQNPENDNTCKGVEVKPEYVPNVKPIVIQQQPNNGSFNCGVGQCSVSPFMSSLTNPCCYPILPLCPINCVQNGYAMPSPSYTCVTCCNKNNEQSRNNENTFTNINQDITHNETQELIKEIYKAVAQSPVSARNQRKCNLEKKNFTSRSVGSTSKTTKHDAMVETPAMKCYSKSCEAIPSPRIASETYHSTNPSYSDTILERLSIEVTQSSTESDTNINREKKIKKNKSPNVWKRFGFFKRKKKDIIEEESESVSSVEVKIKPKTKSPFKQHIIDYNVHDQRYFQSLPISRPKNNYHRNQKPDKHCCGDDFHYQCSPYDMNGPYRRSHDHHAPCYHPPQKPTIAPPYYGYDYDHCCHAALPPHVPYCLKEIEVKSTSTQSERRISVLQKIKEKVAAQQMEQDKAKEAKEKSILMTLKKLAEKAKQDNSDSFNFSLKTQKQLAEGDTKLRNAVLKKMFYKRNPFSPRNLIVRTLMGKDKSSFGDPPKMFKPRMFI